MRETTFRAPWGAPLALMTSVGMIICLITPIPGLLIALNGNGPMARAWGLSIVPQWAGWLMAVVPVTTVVLSAVFMVRGYVLTENLLTIKRPGWKTRFDLSKFVSAAIDPEALRGSTRLCGNGGVFSFVGWFRSSKLGIYRAFATDARKAVVLRFSGRTIVISPDDPQKFVAEINSYRTLSQ